VPSSSSGEALVDVQAAIVRARVIEAALAMIKRGPVAR
jgi:hypothetical protein